MPAALRISTIRSLLSAFALLLALPAGAGPVIGPSKCDAAKFKAAGAYAQGLAACRSKAAKQGAGGTYLDDARCVPSRECLGPP